MFPDTRATVFGRLTIEDAGQYIAILQTSSDFMATSMSLQGSPPLSTGNPKRDERMQDELW
jgi:hypothetical protein